MRGTTSPSGNEKKTAASGHVHQYSMESGQHKYRHHARTGPCHDPRRLSRPHHGQQLVLVFCQKRRCPRPRPPRAHRRQKQHGWRAPVTSKPVTVVRAPERARATALYSACAFWARLPAVARWLWRFPLHTMALGEVQRLCDVVFSAPAAPAGSGMAGCNKHGLNRLLFIISEIM